MAGRTIDKLYIQLEAQTRGLERDLAKADRSIKGFADRTTKKLKLVGKAFTGMGLAVAAAGTAFVAMGQRALAANETIADTAAKANVAVETLQEMRFVALQNGASARDMDDAFTRLNRRMGLFINNGGGPAANAIKKLGLEADIMSGKLGSNEAIFLEVVRRLEDIENQAQRSALQSEFFGDDAGPRLNQLLALGVKGIEQWRDRARELGLVIDKDVVTSAATANLRFKELGEIISIRFVKLIGENADSFGELATKLGEVATWAFNATEGFLRLLGVLKPQGELQELEYEVENLRKTLVGIKAGVETGSATEIQALINDLEKKILELREARSDLRETASGGGLTAFPSGAPSGGSDVSSPRESYGFGDYFSAQVERMRSEMTALAEQAQRNAERMQTAFDRAAGRIGDAFASMLADGKVTFDEIKDVFRQTIASMLQSLVSSGIQKLIGNLFSGLTGGSGGGIGGAFLSLFGRAGGGHVSGGRPYLVGERGPEIYIPNTDGRIAPNVGGGSTFAPTVQVTVNGGAGGGGPEQGRAIGQAVMREMQGLFRQWMAEEKRNGGQLSRGLA